MTISTEDALIAGVTTLTNRAEDFEETAERIADRDWDRARHFYRIAGRNRREARRLRKLQREIRRP